MSGPPFYCWGCGERKQLVERDTMLGDKYSCTNPDCRLSTDDEPVSEVDA